MTISRSSQMFHDRARRGHVEIVPASRGLGLTGRMEVAAVAALVVGGHCTLSDDAAAYSRIIGGWIAGNAQARAAGYRIRLDLIVTGACSWHGRLSYGKAVSAWHRRGVKADVSDSTYPPSKPPRHNALLWRSPGNNDTPNVRDNNESPPGSGTNSESKRNLGGVKNG